MPLPEKLTQHFDHEKLEVYNTSIGFVAFANQIACALPKGNAYLTDQFRRASSSITLNIAEGAGEFSQSEKARFYRIAKRSATECAAILDVCKKLALVENGTYEDARALLLRIVSMLTKLVQAMRTA